jgi:hypothetical protein
VTSDIPKLRYTYLAPIDASSGSVSMASMSFWESEYRTNHILIFFKNGTSSRRISVVVLVGIHVHVQIMDVNVDSLGLTRVWGTSRQ